MLVKMCCQFNSRPLNKVKTNKHDEGKLKTLKSSKCPFLPATTINPSTKL